MILFAAVIVSLLNMLSHCYCVGGEKHNHKGPQTRGRINGGKGRDSAIQCFITVIRVYVVRILWFANSIATVGVHATKSFTINTLIRGLHKTKTL